LLTNVYFYCLAGSSFITNNFGEVTQKADQASEAVLVADLDLGAFAGQRASWGLFRDRRPELYGALLTKDGINKC
jgi:N-carbamoylputrescine amidase